MLTAALLAASCSLGGAPAPGPSEERPQVDDVSTREAVPTIHLLTKTAANDPTRFEMSRIIVEAWREAGIPAELMPVDDAQLNSRTFTGKDYDAFVVSYGPTPERLDPENLLSRFYSLNATDAGTNVSMFQNQEYDDAYQAQSTATDPEARRKAVQDAQRILYEQLPVVPLLYPVVGAGYRSDRWDGIEPSVGYPLFNIWNTTNATAKDDRDVLVVGTTFDPPTLNPVLAETLESQLPMLHMYDTLLAVGPDGETVERAAERIETDGTEITLQLRDGMTFSDGQPVTAEDVVFSIEYLRDKGAPLYAAALESVSSVSADDLTVTLVLDGPAAHFPDVTLTQMPILPQHIWASVEDPAAFANESPVGSGPFILQQRRLGSSITFTANENHYEPASVARLELAILGSFDAGVGALTSGEIDLFDDVQPALQYRSLEDVEDVTVVETQSHGWRGLHYNTSKAPFNDLHFRQALTALIPIEDLIDVVLQGDAEPGGSVIAPSLKTWHNPELEPFTYDVAEAMNALKEAGYAFGPDDELYYPDPEDDGREISDAQGS